MMGLLETLLGPDRPKTFAPTVFERPWVVVYETPVAAGWQSNDDERRVQGLLRRTLKFRVGGPEGRLNLSVTDYERPASDRQDVAVLLARDYRAEFAPLFVEVTPARVHETTQTTFSGARPAVEFVLDGVGRLGAVTSPLRIRERYTPLPGHMLIVSASGSPTLFERHAEDVERWFASVAFRV
jgi:hypothetical protein